MNDAGRYLDGRHGPGAPLNTVERVGVVLLCAGAVGYGLIFAVGLWLWLMLPHSIYDAYVKPTWSGPCLTAGALVVSGIGLFQINSWALKMAAAMRRRPTLQ